MSLLSLKYSRARERSFALLEHLIVIGILATVAIIAINPSEYLKRSRDTKRVQDLSALNRAIVYSQGINFNLNNPNVVYASLPDTASSHLRLL